MAALRVVGPGETPPKPTNPKTLTEAANSGTKRELLVAMRDRIARAVANENTLARDLAALTKRLMEIVRDIEAIDLAEKLEAERAGDIADQPFDASAI